jgi:two-component system, response regulator YesN
MITALVVDDELIIRKGIAKIVEQYAGQKLNVLSASNGSEALEILANQSVQMVLTDVRMPRMDGIELCERIYHQYPSIMVIVVSGFDDFSYARKAMHYGVREYMLKPVYPPDMYSVLDKLFKEQSNAGQIVSLSLYETWTDEMEESIWNLNMIRISELLLQLDEHCMKWGGRSEQLAQLLHDSLESIKKRMQKRSFPSQIGMIPQLGIHMPIAEILAMFKAEIFEAVHQLERFRGAKFKDPFVEAKKYIDEHLAEEITLEELAHRIGITPTYFSHLFKKEINETFVQYRTRKRMEKAKELMEVPHFRIIDICQDVGYTDYPHFTKTFKKYYGVSPSEYRKRMGILA